jgi:hypothetical protein
MRKVSESLTLRSAYGYALFFTTEVTEHTEELC